MVLIVIDDATRSMITPESMPFATRELADRGSSFEDFVAVSPLCCPSRANLLTGQYGHNNGVLKNNYGELENKGRILPRWLQNAGYNTIHVGKYLNNFTKALDPPTAVPAGWDEWFTTLNNNYYDYEVSDNGKLVEFGSEPDDYLTRVLNRKAVEMASEYAEDERPFYMQIDHYAPHLSPKRDGSKCEKGTIPDPDDIAGVDDWPTPDSGNRNEADITDKPWFIRRLERLSKGSLRLADERFRCATASLPAVDRGLKKLFESLAEAGELDDTAFFFTSDNGFFFGEHRIPKKKEFPYEENLRMPLLVKLPERMRPQPRTIPELTATIDVAPTILALAEGEPCTEKGKCRDLDGRSLLPLLERGGERRWPADRTLLVELDQTPSGRQKRARPCSYVGVRTKNSIFVQHRAAAAPGTRCMPTRATEHYDLDKDPRQLDNLTASGSERGRERALRKRLRELQGCAGNEETAKRNAHACN